MTHCALIIDDEADIRELITLALERIGLDVHTAANLEEARNLLTNYHFDVCLSDMRLPDGNGAEFITQIQKIQPGLPVAVITAHGNMQAAVEAMKNGAFDFVSKPVDLTLLRGLVLQAIDSTDQPGSTASQSTGRYIDNANVSLKSMAGLSAKDSDLCDGELRGGDRLVGRSQPIRELRKLISKVARTNAPVWITGESGTGKELIARLIHDNGARSGEAFIAINCGAIPSELMESEMFGHLKGSFTGAHSDSPGLFRQADGGTLFLDEVSELPLQMQVKLLRAIQERSIKPVGSTTETSVDVRILSACNVNLAEAVQQGEFRSDLFYRLNVIAIESPPLRSRREDIPYLVRYILKNSLMNDQINGNSVIAQDAMDALMTYDFPGNVRELENLIERACALSERGTIHASDLALNPSSQFLHSDTKNHQQSDQVDADTILAALEQTRWNRTAAAQLLGVSYRQLRYRIQKLGLDGSAH